MFYEFVKIFEGLKASHVTGAVKFPAVHMGFVLHSFLFIYLFFFHESLRKIFPNHVAYMILFFISLFKEKKKC